MSLDFDMTPWQNWAGSLSVTPVAHCRPQGLSDLVGFVQQAEQNGKRVRAVGSSWSFSDIAMTPDYVVETNLLNQVLNTVNPGALNDEASGRKRNLLHVEAGIKLADLMTLLDMKSWAVPTMGGADGQTLAGALSTSVHGADFDRGPLPEMMRAIHLVGPGGIQHWIEPKQGITDPTRLQQALGLDPTNIHYDDDWFNSVLVSVGCLGIIYSLIIEVRDQYDLVEECSHHTWADLRAKLDAGEPFAPPTHCVQVAVDPSPGHACFLITRKEDNPSEAVKNDGCDPLGLFCTTPIAEIVISLAPTAFIEICSATGLIHLIDPILIPILGPLGYPAIPIDKLPGVPALLAPLAPALAAELRKSGALGDVLGKVLNADAGLTAQLVTSITGQFLPAGTKHGFAHTIMAPPNPGECAARGLALEMAFDATGSSYLNFMDEALAILDQAFQVDHLSLGGWFSLRFVGRSRAYLSPQQFDRTCMIEATGLRTLNSTAEILGRLEQAGRKHGGIQHWGMFSIPNLIAEDVFRAYPDLNKWRRIRWLLTQNGALRTFDNDFSERCGLSTVPLPAFSEIVGVGGFASFDDNDRHIIVGTGDGDATEVFYNTPNASGNVVLTNLAGIASMGGFFSSDDNFRHAIIATRDGNVTEFFYNPRMGSGQSVLTNLKGIVGIAGFFSSDDNFRHVIAATNDGNVTEFFFHPTLGSGQSVLTNLNDIIGIAGFFSSDDNFRHAIIATKDGNVTEFFYHPKLGSGQSVLTNLSGIIGVAGFFSSDDNFRHVIAATNGGNVTEFFFHPTLGSGQSVLAHFNGIVAVAGFFTPDDNARHVIIATNDGELHEVWYNAQRGIVVR